MLCNNMACITARGAAQIGGPKVVRQALCSPHERNTPLGVTVAEVLMARSIGRSSRRENILLGHGVEPEGLIRTRLANHIRASSRENGCTKQARHMTALDRNRRHANSALGRRPHMGTSKNRLM